MPKAGMLPNGSILEPPHPRGYPLPPEGTPVSAPTCMAPSKDKAKPLAPRP